MLLLTDSPSLCLFQEIYKDRKKFSKQVFEVASSDLVNMGITVVSYTLKDIRDDEVTAGIFLFVHGSSLAGDCQFRLKELKYLVKAT